jgi:hypothetical protein
VSRAVAAAALLLLLAAPAAAAEREAGIGSFEFQAGQYRPEIDTGFTMPAGLLPPFEASFGTSKRWLFKLHGGKALVHGFGTLEVGGGIGWVKFSGHGRFAPTAPGQNGEVSQDPTSFRVLPLSLDLTWRIDQVWERAGIPVVPYARVALLRNQWWATGASGRTDKSGATNGWGWGGGIGLVLDFIDQTLARELERDSGIKHTMLVFEAQDAKLDDFGSSSSWDLSNAGVSLTFGLMFTF